MSKLTRVALCFALVGAGTDAAAGTLPTELTLIPAPDAQGWVQGVDGRRFRADAKAVVAAFNRRLPIDENHATHLAAGAPAPAFGWVKALRVADDGAVIGEVTWNKRGAAAIADGDYGYLSPAFDLDDSNQVLRLVSVGLTNDPNFPQLALNRAASTAAEEAPVMSLSKAIALALGLAESATETEAVVAINSVKAKAATPDLAQYVPRADHQLVLNRADTAERSLAEFKKGQQTAEIESAINAALTAGTITPASADYHRAVCAQEGGLEKFKAYVAAAPAVVAPGTPAGKPASGATSLNAVEKECAAALGISEADYLAEKNRLAGIKTAA